MCTKMLCWWNIVFYISRDCHQISRLILGEVLRELIDNFYSPWKSLGFLRTLGGTKSLILVLEAKLGGDS